MRILAVDQGTTSTRGIVFDRDGRSQTVFYREHRQSYPRSGWVEHDPDELLGNVRACFEAALASSGVMAAGIANQGESCLAWDAEDGAPVGPVIVWQDGRTADDLARLKAEGAEAMTLERAGLPLDSYFSASKLGWIARNNARAKELAALGRLRLGTTDAFFRDRLTGCFETDLTTASRTSLLNLEACQWDEELCALFGVPVDALPSITPTSGALGTAAFDGGITPLTASIVDQQAALYGHGCRRPGDVKITFGTGAFALTVTSTGKPASRHGLLPTIAWQEAGERPVYALDGGVYTVSAAVNWARSIGLFDDFDEIAVFDGPAAAERGLYFVPALAGLACPHWDRDARGSWMGLSLDTTKQDMVRAILEGIAFRTAEVVEAIDAVQPIAGPITIDGGMSANTYFAQFLSDTLAIPLRVSDEPELSALGVGMLAAEASGMIIDRPQKGAMVAPRPQPVAWRKGFLSARQAVQAFGAAFAAEATS
ncbi:FGGY family carbohydrate kinase [Hoeflea prorocentri]|uniref:ATP:glycerol 3-phosphotransferase n=1 Tax=Hoeflea prorocentri TaxID=1922333 RepID=A0A9X3UJR1_9HYPH|nr:FGGY family carbohydrate kinase [Hoeflea prorocentri]MCY6381924.1 FGGY family carbohydrate kinase [Hoeflea prorocentri]MDA5399724.1 FGGY family carbohydrate kinase [Hoeflea prorocentri]